MMLILFVISHKNISSFNIFYHEMRPWDKSHPNLKKFIIKSGRKHKKTHTIKSDNGRQHVLKKV